MNKRALSLLLPAMIVPWVLLIAAWKSASQRERHWLLTIFIVIYGATITIAYDPLGAGPDGVRHLLIVYTHYVGLGFGQFMSELWLIVTFRPPVTTNDDVFIHVLSYFVGGVLGEPRFFFPLVALVYGYFFVGSMLEVFRYAGSSKLTYFFVAFGLLFFLIVNIEGVNAVRTHTAMWILVYACLKFYSTKKTRYLMLMFVPPLVHVGFMVLALPAWVVLALGNRKMVYIVLFALSSFTTFINPGTVTEVLSQSELGKAKVAGYYVEERRDLRESDQRAWKWLKEFGLQKWALNVLIYSLLLSHVYTKRMNPYQSTLFSIGLLALTMSNMTWYLFAVSNRSWIVGIVFVLAAFLLFMQSPMTASRVPESRPIYKAGLHISLVLFVPYFAYNLSNLIDFPSVYLIGLPFLAVLSPATNQSIKEFVRLVLDFVF